MNNNNNPTTTPDAELAYFFEGAEKRLEVQFSPSPSSPVGGLLTISREKWTKFLDLVNCQILSVTSNSFFTAYVLSESSLFVFNRKIMIKTCGNTTLLECLPLLFTYAEEINFSLDSVTYSHKNFVQPDRQTESYRSYDRELNILNKYFNGQSFILGPGSTREDADSWFVYHYYSPKSTGGTGTDQKIEIIMSGLERKAMLPYFNPEGDANAQDTSVSTGISNILPGTIVDPHMFEPCGYSMNGLLGDTYSTIHITPEDAFSYVSYESNLKSASYDDVIKRVLAIFKPSHFLVVVYAEKDALLKSNNAFSANLPGFKREDISKCSFNSSLFISCSQFSLVQ